MSLPVPAPSGIAPMSSPALVLVNTFGLAHLWRDLLRGGP
jgi:hypothetical protein